jgi:hypothetical protein
MKRIIYKTADDEVSIIAPSPEWEGTMEELAQKDVPTGLKYKIIEDSDIPNDRSFRNAWEISESELTDGVGA